MQKKIQNLKFLFANYASPDERYDEIIRMGRSLAKLQPVDKVEKNIVAGCQSIVYLRSCETEGNIYFSAESNALVSAGLAALLIHVYSGEPAELIVKTPPDFLEDLGISQSLTPNRANGLYSIHLRMRQDALTFLLPR